VSLSAIHRQALAGVQTVIQGLTLPRLDGTPLPSDQVYLRKRPTDLNVTLPCVVVSLVGRPELLDGTLTGSDDFGYPCLATIITACNQDLTFAADDNGDELLWRQLIRKAFYNKKPAALVSAVSVPLKPCRWEPAPVVEMELLKQANLFISGAIIWVYTREVRT
jgi:hypothetical protein